MLSPRIFADAFYNTKDIPFMVAFIFAMLSMLIFLRSAGLGNRGFAWGMQRFPDCHSCAGDHHSGHYLWRSWRQGGSSSAEPLQAVGVELLAGCMYLIFTMGLTIFFWPILWQNPLLEFGTSLQLMSQYNTWTGQFLYMGEILGRNKIPWHYIPVWISITTPLLYLAGFGIGVIAMLVSLFRQPGGWFEGKKLGTLVVLMCFFGPLLAVILLHSDCLQCVAPDVLYLPGFLADRRPGNAICSSSIGRQIKAIDPGSGGGSFPGDWAAGADHFYGPQPPLSERVF